MKLTVILCYLQRGSTALLLAAKYGHINIVKMVIEKGAHIGIADIVRIKCLAFVDSLNCKRRCAE